MKIIDVGGLAKSSAKKITSVISRKLKENEKKANSKIDLGKLAEKLAERKVKADVDSKNNDDDKDKESDKEE